MPTRLDAMRLNCRLVTRVVGEEVFAATLDLGARLPPELSRARMVCVPVLISVTRDLIDREMRGLPVTRGPSINAIANSLDLPFETVRRNVQKMAELDWMEIGASGGVSLSVPMRAELAIWCVELGRRLRRAAATMEALGATDPGSLGAGTCDNSCILAALDLFLIMAGTSKHFDLRFAELLLIHFVCTTSVVHLNSRPEGSAPFARADTMPADCERAFIPPARPCPHARRVALYRLSHRQRYGACRAVRAARHRGTRVGQVPDQPRLYRGTGAGCWPHRHALFPR
ncbi:hypothetical protein LRS12_14660 [Sphingomonas sp. J344]|uniref:hypothetical protein n=1 Tax=Sphingomonas sp. J344 TaxID=2898434 RepID=UPI002151721E|nr:hypothetical protein [Sphingomonas sp. J344]MCR5871845.1 hypothetical protein [Sphingomonas sp. J344]